MTRIVIDPPQAHATADVLDRHGRDIEATGLLLARTPLPEMPAGVKAAIAATLAEVSTALAQIGLDVEADARELHLRALLAELEESIEGTDLSGLGSFLRQNGKWAATGLSFFGAGGVLPVVLATASGYRIVPGGKYVTVRGSQFRGPACSPPTSARGACPGRGTAPTTRRCCASCASTRPRPTPRARRSTSATRRSGRLRARAAGRWR